MCMCASVRVALFNTSGSINITLGPPPPHRKTHGSPATGHLHTLLKFQHERPFYLAHKRFSIYSVYTHTYVLYTHTHTNTHTRINIRTRARTHTHTHVRVNTCTCKRGFGLSGAAGRERLIPSGWGEGGATGGIEKVGVFPSASQD